MLYLIRKNSRNDESDGRETKRGVRENSGPEKSEKGENRQDKREVRQYFSFCIRSERDRMRNMKRSILSEIEQRGESEIWILTY